MNTQEPCPRIEALSALTDGELREPERLAVQAHVDHCAICAPVLAEFRQLQTRFAALDVDDARVRRRSGGRPPHRRRERTRPARTDARGAAAARAVVAGRRAGARRRGRGFCRTLARCRADAGRAAACPRHRGADGPVLDVAVGRAVPSAAGLRRGRAMKRYGWKLLFAASLLVNVGVIAAVWLAGQPSNGAGERVFFGMGHDQVAGHLKLDAAQRERWKIMEAGFIGELERIRSTYREPPRTHGARDPVGATGRRGDRAGAGRDLRAAGSTAAGGDRATAQGARDASTGTARRIGAAAAGTACADSRPATRPHTNSWVGNKFATRSFVS